MSATVHQAFRDSAARHGAQPFLCILPETAEAYGIAAGELAYGAAAEAIETLRAAYARAGYGHGHRAGLLLENRPAFFLHWFALNALGVSVVPINPDLRAAELEYLTGHSEIALAVALPGHAELLAAAARAGRELRVMGPTTRPRRALRRAAGRQRAGRAERMRAAVHVRHHRPAQGLHPAQLAISCTPAAGTRA